MDRTENKSNESSGVKGMSLGKRLCPLKPEMFLLLHNTPFSKPKMERGEREIRSPGTLVEIKEA